MTTFTVLRFLASLINMGLAEILHLLLFHTFSRITSARLAEMAGLAALLHVCVEFVCFSFSFLSVYGLGITPNGRCALPGPFLAVLTCFQMEAGKLTMHYNR